MLIVTIDSIPGHEIEALGLVKGGVVNTKNMFIDLFQSLKTLVGGELRGYTDMMDEARQSATNRMIKQAESLHADAIVGVRYATSSILQCCSEVIVYGTAVRFRGRGK